MLYVFVSSFIRPGESTYIFVKSFTVVIFLLFLVRSSLAERKTNYYILDWNRHSQFKSQLRSRPGLHIATQQLGPLAQAHQPKVAFGTRHNLCRDRWPRATALIAHAHLHHHVVALYHHIGLLRLRIFIGVCQPFLHRPVDRAGHSCIESDQIADDAQANPHRR